MKGRTSIRTRRIAHTTALILGLCLASVLQYGTSHAASLRFESSVLWSGPHDVEISGSLAYGAYTSGIAIFDISDPTAPTLVSRLDCRAPVHALDYDDGRLYLAHEEDGFTILDVSNPLEPREVGSVAKECWAMDLCARQGYLYLGAGWSGRFQVYDVHDPSLPTLVGELENVGGTIQIAGDFAYIGGGMDGGYIIDIREPTDPRFVSRLEFPQWTVRVEGNYSFGVWVNGSKRAEGGAAQTDDHGTDGPALPHVQRPERDSGGLVVYDISDPYHPVQVYNEPDPIGISSLEIADGLAYCALWNGHLGVLDISDPTNLVPVGSLPLGSIPWGISVQGDLACVGCSSYGLAVIDLADPRTPVEAGRYWESGGSTDIATLDGFAYVVDMVYGIHVLDMADPGRPVVLEGVELPNYPRAIRIRDAVAYVACDASGLCILDLEDPAHPAVVGTAPVTCLDAEVAASGASLYAYLVSRYEGLTVLDVTNPADPAVVANCSLPGWPSNVSVRDGLACVATGPALAVVDVHDPLHPVPRGSWGTPEFVDDVVCGDGVAYVSAGNDGILVIDLSDPDNPIVVRDIRVYGLTNGGRLEGDRLYWGASGVGVLVFDVSDPRNPIELSRAHTNGGARNVAADGSGVYVADGGSVVVFSETPSAAPDLGRTGLEIISLRAPNPLREGDTEVTVTLAAPAPLRVELFDACGRRVATVFNGAGARGDNRLRWSSRTIPSGVYYLSATASDRNASQSVVLIR